MRFRISRWMGVCVVPAVLVACGGGGGGSSSNGSSGGGTVDNSWLSFTPTAVNLNIVEKQTLRFEVTANSSKTITDAFQVGIVDAGGVIDAASTLVNANSATNYTASMLLRADLTPGVHTGRFEVRLCKDVPTTCAQPISGSPWFVPYTVTVQSNTNLKTLTPLAGAGDWGMFQGSARHTGYVPAQLDPAQFSRRFVYEAGTGIWMTELVTAGGLAVGATGSAGISWDVFAIDEATGQRRWTQAMGAADWINPPAFAGGKVYVTGTNSLAAASSQESGFLTTLSAADGHPMSKLTGPSQAQHYLSPTVTADGVYTPAGAQSGLARFSIDGLSQTWFQASLPSLGSGWTPAVDGAFAYSLLDDQLIVSNTADGSTAFKITDPACNGQCRYGMRAAPVVADGGVVFVSQHAGVGGQRVLRYDTATRSIAWSAGSYIVSQPVLVGDKVYVLEGPVLQERSAATGAVQWSWTSPSNIDNVPMFNAPVPLLVVGHHAFLMTNDGVKAVDLTTHQQVWSDPATGALSVSANGVLYISGNKQVVAVNLH